MAALTTAAGAARQTFRRGAVDRTGQGRLRRHQHGHGAAMARLRRHGGLPRVHRDSPAAVSDRALGLPRLDSGADRPVDACTHRGRDRRTGAAVQVAARPARQRFDDPGDGPPAGASRLCGQPGRVPAATGAVVDVGGPAGADPQRAEGRRRRRRMPLAAKAIGVANPIRRTAPRWCQSH